MPRLPLLLLLLCAACATGAAAGLRRTGGRATLGDVGTVPAPCRALPYNTSRLVGHAEVEGTPTFLFRGPAPTALNHSRFMETELFACFEALAARQGLALPAGAALVDVNLQSPSTRPDEAADVQTELDWLSAAAGRGRMLHWQMVGDEEDPADVPAAERLARAAALPQWQADALDARVARVRALITSAAECQVCGAPAGPPAVVVMVHCTGGKDRTGELMGSYAMRHLRASFAEVVAWDAAVAGRGIGQGNYNAMKWYCNYLLATGQAEEGEDCKAANP